MKDLGLVRGQVKKGVALLMLNEQRDCAKECKEVRSKVDVG